MMFTESAGRPSCSLDRRRRHLGGHRPLGRTRLWIVARCAASILSDRAGHTCCDGSPRSGGLANADRACRPRPAGRTITSSRRSARVCSVRRRATTHVCVDVSPRHPRGFWSAPSRDVATTLCVRRRTRRTGCRSRHSRTCRTTLDRGARNRRPEFDRRAERDHRGRGDRARGRSDRLDRRRFRREFRRRSTSPTPVAAAHSCTVRRQRRRRAATEALGQRHELPRRTLDRCAQVCPRYRDDSRN